MRSCRYEGWVLASSLIIQVYVLLLSVCHQSSVFSEVAEFTEARPAGLSLAKLSTVISYTENSLTDDCLHAYGSHRRQHFANDSHRCAHCTYPKFARTERANF